MNKLKLFLAITISTFIGCGPDATNDVDDGNIVRDAEGKIVSGELRKFYASGKLESVFNVANYKLNGSAKKYYEDGVTMRSELVYQDGKLDGMQKRYYKSGALYKEEPYVNGERHGLVKKYRESGKLMTEVDYKNGQPGTILKEYLTDGRLKTKYPKIVVEEIDDLRASGEFTVRVSMSDGTKNVKYYLGELDEGVYFSEALRENHDVKDGVLELKAYLKRGEKLNQELNIVARMPTRLNNAYITSHRIRINVSR